MSKCVRESSKSLGALTLPPEQPREFALPEGRSYNADPTPFRRVRGGLPRAARQPGPVPPPSMSTVPSQTSAGGARFLHAHHRRFHFRRMDPRAPLSVRVLPAYRIVAAGIRLAVLALQRHRDRRVPGGAAGPRQDTRGSASAGSALSARAVVDPPFSRPGRSSRGRAIRAHRSAARAEFRGSCTHHA